jgi:small subunit ribosomal protein S20
MAIIKSAKKAIRSSARKRGYNLDRKRALTEVLKNYKKLVEAKKLKEAEKLIPSLYQAFDKAAKNGIIKANNASRRKARLYAMLGLSKKA